MNLKFVLVGVFTALLAGCAPQIAVNKNSDLSRIKKIAVLEFSAVGQDPSVGGMVANQFNYALLQGGFDVVERTYIDQILNEKKLQLAGIVAPDQIKQIGTLLGASAVLVGSVDRLVPEAQKEKALIEVNFRLVDTDTASLIATGSQMEKAKTSSLAAKKAALKLIKFLKREIESRRAVK